MIDLAFNRDFDAHIGPDGDFATVTGRAAFEQGLTFIVTQYFHEVIGEFGRKNIREKIKLRANRVVDDSDFVSAVDSISVEFSETQAGVVEVTIHYIAGDEYSTLIQ